MRISQRPNRNILVSYLGLDSTYLHPSEVHLNPYTIIYSIVLGNPIHPIKEVIYMFICTIHLYHTFVPYICTIHLYHTFVETHGVTDTMSTYSLNWQRHQLH